MAKQSQKAPAAVRVLTPIQVEGVNYASNDLVQFPAELAASLLAAGAVDDSSAAVDYCLTLGATPTEHKGA